MDKIEYKQFKVKAYQAYTREEFKEVIRLLAKIAYKLYKENGRLRQQLRAYKLLNKERLKC